MTGDRLVLPTGETITVLRNGAGTAGAVFEFDGVIPPRGTGPPAHLHRVEQEEFTVLEGVLRARVGGWTSDLTIGESVVVPPGTVHSFANLTDRPTRMITRSTPAGQLEEQFQLLASGGRVPPLLRMAELNVRHDLSFVVHGVPEPIQRALWRSLAAVHRLRRGR